MSHFQFVIIMNINDSLQHLNSISYTEHGSKVKNQSSEELADIKCKVSFIQKNIFPVCALRNSINEDNLNGEKEARLHEVL